MTAPPSPALTRRGFLAGGLGVGLFVVAGCGSDDDADDPSAGDGTAADVAFPRTVTHKYGETVIPTAPERVVTVGLSDADYVLALGLVPAALTDWYGDYEYGVWPWATDELGDGRPEVMPRNEDQLNFELIRTMRPDLIIGQYTGRSDADYGSLSDIAPMVAQSAEFPDYGMPWEATMLAVGDAVGRPDEAAAIVADIEARFAAAREDNPQFAGRTVVVAEKFDTFVVRGATDPRTRFLTQLGFVLPDDLVALTEGTDAEPISEEQLVLLDRDLLVWNAGFTPELGDELAGNPLYQQLAVVQEGRAVLLEEATLSGALTWSTVLSLPLALEELVPVLAAALEG